MNSNNVPEWDLSSLYKSLDDPLIKQDKDNAASKIANFIKLYKGKIVNLSANELLLSIKEYEEISVLLGKVMSYSYLSYVTDVTNKNLAIFMQQNREFITNLSTDLAFYELELNDLDDAILEQYLAENQQLKKYSSFLETNKRFKPYQLPEIAEQVFIAKSSVSGSAWVRLYDETLAGLEFKNPITQETINLSTALNFLLNEEKEVRDNTAEELKIGLAKKEDLIVTCINNIVKDQAIGRNFRKFKNPYSAMNLSNMISDSIMETMVEAVKDSYFNIAHRYYKLKAKVLGFDKLKYWDRNAPMFSSNKKFSFKETEELVKAAYYDFDKGFGDIISLFFNNNWIDAKLRPNKESGAFCHPTVTTNHPFILMNFHGDYNDVTTLAHELGHGVHQYLAREVGELQSGTPLVLAETASIFGEQLVFDNLINKAENIEVKKFLLSNKIEGVINSVHRQIAFHCFEERIHIFREQKELTKDEIKQIFIETQRDCLGDAVQLSPDDGIFWSYVSHFFHSPFYVYAYGFADCLVRSLYALYKSNYPDFKQKYITLLSNGGLITPENALKEFGFTLSDKKFWQNGLTLTINLIEQLEAIV
ncbi:M3 family oligoendopeptidase [Rickettsiales bacterium LUAb2]